MATSITSMHHAKGCPVALATPDGKKIIVFSKRFPYCFASRSRFLLQMPFGAFSLDLDLDPMATKRWSVLCSPPIVPPTKNKMDNLDRCYIETFMYRFALKPALIPDWCDAGRFFKAAFQVYDHGDQGFYRKEATKNYFGQYMRPLSAFDPFYIDRQSFLSIIPLCPIKEEEEEEQEQVSTTCVLQVELGLHHFAS
ncbi:hypothetical protein OROHE_016106 [Orobanche hederae]